MVDTLLLLLLLLLLSLWSKVLSLSCHLEFKFKIREISPGQVMSSGRLPRNSPRLKNPAGWVLGAEGTFQENSLELQRST